MNATTATAPKQARKPRPRPARRIRVLEQPSADTEGWCAIEITEGKKTDRYLLRSIPTDFGNGALAFEIEKLDADLNTAAVYHTLLDGPNSSCDCPGGTYCGHCRHREGIDALRKAGRLLTLNFRSPGDLAANDPERYAQLVADSDDTGYVPPPAIDIYPDEEPPQLEESAYYEPDDAA